MHPPVFTAHQPLQLSPDEEVHVMSRLFGGQASDLRYRRQTWSRYSADCCLIARQPAGTGEALADRQWCDPNLSCSAFGFSLGGNIHVSSHVHAKVTPSNAIKGWQIIFSRSTKSEHAKTWRLLVCTLWRRYLKGEPSVNTFIRKEIVRSFKCLIWPSRTTHGSWGILLDIFFNHPVFWWKPNCRWPNARSTVPPPMRYFDVEPKSCIERMRPKVGGVPTPLGEASLPPVNLSTLDTNNVWAVWNWITF